MGLFANPLSYAGYPPGDTGTPSTQNTTVRAATAEEAADGLLDNCYLSPATAESATALDFASPPALGFGSTTPRPVHATTLDSTSTTSLGTGASAVVNVASGASATLGFYGATAVAKPASTDDIRTALINLGLYTTGGASPLNLNGGALTSGNLTAVGTVNVNASGAGITTIGTGGTGATNIGNATGNTAVTGSLTASTGLVATTGGVTASAGNISAAAGSVSASTTVTAGTGITATTGNIAASSGNISASGTVTGGTGVIATTGGVTATAGDITATDGNVIINGAAKQLRCHGGAVTDFIGQATLTNGTVTVANTNIAATDRVLVTRSAKNASTAYGTFEVTITASTNFVITSCKSDTTTETNDASTVDYFIVRQV